MKKLLLIFLCTLPPLFLIAQQYRVIINEVFYDTPFPNEGQNPHMHNGEFASIYNFGTVPIDVSGWRLVSDPNQIFTFPAGSIMQPGARFFVAYRGLQSSSFVLSDLFEGFEPEINDMIFYMRTIVHANGGDAVMLFRLDGTLQDSMRYEGTSQRTLPNRLEALNADHTPGNESVSLQRRNITVDENGVISFDRLDWHTNTVALSKTQVELTVNGVPIANMPPAVNNHRTVFIYDASGNRKSRRTIVLHTLEPAQSAPRRVSAFAENHDNENDYMSNTMEMPENNEFLDNFYTDRLNESDVVIFPNPTRGALAVEIRNKNPNIPHQITVFNLSGSIVFQKNDIGNLTEIDLSSHPRGVYLLRISSPDSFITWRIIRE